LISSSIFGSPNAAVSMTVVPKELRGTASGIRTMIIYFAQIMGMIVLFGLLNEHVPLMELMNLFLHLTVNYFLIIGFDYGRYGGGGSSNPITINVSTLQRAISVSSE
jgi:hypothetical protein